MQLLIFILVYPIIWIFSILPFRLLYIISDLLYYIIYYIVGYRKKVVFDNLTLTFPNKSKDEIVKISKKFYKHFIDIFFVEMIKSFTMSKKEMAKRYKPTNIEVLHDLESKGKSGILLGAHYANWEWIFNFNLLIKYNGYAVYKKIKNPYFDRQVRKTRGRFNTHLIPTKQAVTFIQKNNEDNILSLYGFLGDQSPKSAKAYHWGNFLGVRVPIYTGAEFLAKKYNLAIVLFSTKKIKRGYYESTLKLLTDTPKDYKNYELTDLFLREVEKQIEEVPEYYLWTHKRFKHADKKTH